MDTFSTTLIGDTIRDLLLYSAFNLPEKVQKDLETALEQETSSLGRSVLSQLIENSSIARQQHLPLCQDTGLAQVLILLGQELHLSPVPILSESVDRGVRDAYDKGFLRKSSCGPLNRLNRGDNTPASLETIIVSGSGLKIYTLSKGGGCDNRSRLINLKPTATRQDIIDSIVETVLMAGPDACPPFYLGINIGGTFESAPRLARRALMELWLGTPMTDEELLLADEVLNLVNQTGLGPLGLGGKTTVLDLRIKIHPTHLASLPIAVNLNCHSLRLNYAELN